jgi:tetratricopeptide (TPR) repeat protein
MKRGLAVVLLVALSLGQSLARAEPPRSPERAARPVDLATPPEHARRTQSGVPYVILRRGRGQPARMLQDEVTYRYTVLRHDGVTVASAVVRDQSLGSQPAPLDEALETMTKSEKRRLWLASMPPGFHGTSDRGTKPIVLDVELLAIRRKRYALPDGMRIVCSREQRALTIAQGDVKAPLPLEAGRMANARERRYPIELVTVEPAADRASVDVSLLDDCHGKTFVVSYRIATLKARVENAAGLGLHRAGKYAEAEQGFRRAVALDPDFDLGYTNLASALALQGKTTEAVDVLGPLLARNPAWAYFKILDDAELVSLAHAPEIRALRAPVNGTARVDQLSASAAWSERHRLIATVVTEESWGAGGEFETALWIVAPDGTPRVRMQLVLEHETGSNCIDNCPPRVAPDARPAVAARKLRADELLAALGFSPVPDAAGRLLKRPIPRFVFDKARLALVPDVDKVRVVRGNDVLVEADTPGYRTNWATLLPGMIAYGWTRPAREGCEGMDPSGVAIIPSPRLPLTK